MASTVEMGIYEKADQRVDSISKEIREIRRYLHTRPEASENEYKTTAFLAERFEEIGLNYRIMPTQRGLLADSENQSAPVRIGLRADIDALRLQDEKTVIYRSTETNLMHACGHDAHTAMLLGACMALHSIRSEVGSSLTWRAIFQPAEETASGAMEMIGFDAIKGVDSIIALHVDPAYTAGEAGWRAGCLTALCEEFDITVTGQGGHGARPHQTIDPIAAATEFVNACYQTIPRMIDTREPAVISFGVFQGGINPNVIPEHVQLRGTIRTIHHGTSRFIKKKMRDIADGIAKATGVTFTIEIPYFLESVNNDPRVTEHCRKAAAEIVGRDNLKWIEKPSMGGEDFAYYLKWIPGCMLRLGVGTPGKPPRYLHTPKFDIDESALVIGTKILVRSVLRLSNATS